MHDCDANNFNYLYNAVETFRAQMTPARLGIKIMEEWFNDSKNPFYNSGYARIMRANLVLAERMTRKYEKPEFNITDCNIDGKTFKIEEKTILRKAFCDLKHFHKISIKQEMPKLLIVAPMAGHHATLLRSTVQEMLPYCEVYITDWIDASLIPKNLGKFDMDDFIDYMIEFISFLGPNVHIMAVCQPTVPVLAATSIMSSNKDKNVPKSMILIGGPVDARKSPTEVNLFATSKSLEWFREMVIMNVPSNYPGVGRKVYPGFLQLAGFIAMNLPRHIESHLDLLQNLLEGDSEKANHTTKFYDEYLASMDMTAEFYLQTIEEVFHEFALAKGELVSNNRKIDLRDITKCALLGIEGEFDDVAAIGQTKAALDLCSNIPDSMKKYHLQKGVGHYGVFSGHKFKQFIVPVIKDFIYTICK